MNADDNIDEIITRRIDSLTGNNHDVMDTGALRSSIKSFTDSIISIYKSMNKSEGRTSLWADLPIDKYGSKGEHSTNLNDSYDRLYILAQGYAVKDTDFFHDEKLKKDIVSAFCFLTEYYARKKRRGNWWSLEIGIPRAGVNTIYILKDELNASDITTFLDACLWYVPNPNSRNRTSADVETGANLADKALNYYLIGLFKRNKIIMRQARNALYDTMSNGKRSLFVYVTTGDGFYTDGSFIQHTTVPYISGYGAVLFGSLGQMLLLLAGTNDDIKEEDKNYLYQIFDNNIRPFIWRGRAVDTVRGRGISRETQKDYNAGYRLIYALVVMFGNGTVEHKISVYSAARSWLKQLNHSPVDDPSLAIAQKKLLQSIIDDDAYPVTENTVSSTRIFPYQERIIHLREKWMFTVNLSSKFISRLEWGNNENVNAWNQGDGMTFLYLNDDSDQFSEDFWPTVDSGALPGITLDAIPQIPHGGGGVVAPLGTGSYSGGVVLNERYGSVGMQVTSYSTYTRSLKTWVLLDDAVICVGSGVQGTSGTEVKTIVENRGFAPNNVPQINIDGVELPPSEGGLTVKKTLHITGCAGYILLDDHLATLTAQQRSGSWRDINRIKTVGSDEIKHRSYLSLTISHGTDPKSDDYAYMVLPGASAEQTQRRASDVGIRVFNSSGAHIVQVTEINATFGHIFVGGKYEGITSNGPCAFAWQIDVQNQQVILSLSVPVTSEIESTVTLTLPDTLLVKKAISVPDNVQVIGLSPVTVQMTVPGRDRTQRSIILSL